MADSPDFATALGRHREGDLAEAERLYREILTGQDHAGALNNLALILDEAGRTAEARGLYLRWTSVAPAEPRAHYSLGNHARRARDLPLAEQAYRRTLDLQPDHPMARMDLALTLLGQGRYAEGWPLYGARRARADMLRRGLSFPEWRGEPLAGKRLFVWREQGYGDQIMMARFLKDLGAAQLTYAGDPALQRLFAPLGVSFDPVRPGQDYSVPPHDYWVLPFSLPDILGVTEATIPAAPYLAGEPRRMGGRIGLVWQGAPRNPNQPYRTLPQALAQRLLARPGVISLAPEDTGARDFQDTADIVAGLDLVVTVDTAVAHLAGAMGAPVWVMLGAHGVDWQWLDRGEETPWYPSARLVRQRRAGDWLEVVERVEGELEAAGL